MKDAVYIQVRGVPVGQPRPRARIVTPKYGGRPFVHVYTPPIAQAWKRKIVAAASQAFSGEPVAEPVRLVIKFMFSRPRSHYRTGKYADQLKASAPTAMAQKPDVDNAIKAVMDALTEAGIWKDDAQVHSIEAHKAWADDGTAGANITVQTMDSTTREAQP